MYEKFNEKLIQIFFKKDSEIHYRDRAAPIMLVIGILYGIFFMFNFAVHTNFNQMVMAIVVGTVLGFILAMILLKLGFVLTAKVAFLIIISANFIITTILFSVDSWFHLFFFAYPVFVYAAFDLSIIRDRIWAVIFIVGSPIAVICLEITAEVASLQLGPESMTMFKLPSAFMVILAMAICILTIAQEIKGKDRRLNYLADTDPLTGAYNRRKIYSEIESEISRYKRYGGDAALLVMDLDEFKNINDMYGHSVGDAALGRFADACMDSIRDNDSFARLGGDEFAILLVETSEQNAKLSAERILASIRQIKIVTENGETSFTASIGMASMPDNLESVDDFVHIADKAMYAAKKAGGNRVVVA